MSQSSTEILPKERVEQALRDAGWSLKTESEPARPTFGAAVLQQDDTGPIGKTFYLLQLGGRVIGTLEISSSLAENPAADELPPENGSKLDRANGDRTTPTPIDGRHWPSPPQPIPRAEHPNAIFIYRTDGKRLLFHDTRENTSPRPIAHFHRPAALSAMATGMTIPFTEETTAPLITSETPVAGETAMARLENLPLVAERGLWQGERATLAELENALRRGERRVLAQMACGSGKTHTLLSLAQRVLQARAANRVLFLVDNDPLAYQTLEEFHAMRAPESRSASGTPIPGDILEEQQANFRVQQLTEEEIRVGSGLIIASPQRLLAQMGYSSEHLVGRTLNDLRTGRALENVLAAREGGQFLDALPFNRNVAADVFDLIVWDNPALASFEAMKRILSYFDAPVVAISGAPSAQLLQFFGGELVSEYPHEQALADGCLLCYDAYRIRVNGGPGEEIGAEAGPLEISKRAKYISRTDRWASQEDAFSLASLLSEPILVGESETADAEVLRVFRDRLALDMFPTRAIVPKTVVVAKDEEHANQLVRLVREVFGRGNHFCQNLLDSELREPTGAPLEEETVSGGYRVIDQRYPVLTSFRHGEHPRVGVVAADSFAITCDLRPAEIILVMAPLRSRSQFEIVKARGVRTMRRTEFLRVTRDGSPVAGKTHALLVDAVGLLDVSVSSDTLPLDRRPTLATAQLLQDVACGNNTPEVLYALSARLLRLDCMLNPAERDQVARAAGGANLHTLATRLLAALDTDRHILHAERNGRIPEELREKAYAQAGTVLIQQAVKRLYQDAELRKLIVQLDRRHHPTVFHGSEEESSDE